MNVFKVKYHFKNKPNRSYVYHLVTSQKRLNEFIQERHPDQKIVVLSIRDLGEYIHSNHRSYSPNETSTRSNTDGR